jgi:hypothetical protein
MVNGEIVVASDLFEPKGGLQVDALAILGREWRRETGDETRLAV